MEITFDEHPARTVFDGEEFPKFPDQKLIRVNGVGTAYLSLVSGGVSFTRTCPPFVVKLVEDEANKYLADKGMTATVSVPPEPPRIDEEDE